MRKLTEPLRYTLHNDAHMRLCNTIVRYKGVPIYVTDVNSDLTIQGLNLRTTGPVHCHSSDVELDISSPPLGWLNYNNRALYLMRAPRNSQKQGVYLKYLTVFNPRKQEVSNGLSIGLSEMVCMADCIDGKHPSIHSILKAGHPSGAFHRNWAICHIGSGVWNLYHKDSGVGIVNQLHRTVYIPQGYLSKTRMLELQECLNSDVAEGGDFYVTEIKKAA